MKVYRQIHEQAKDLSGLEKGAVESLLWKLLCYAPKIPLRMVHQELLDKAEHFQLSVHDAHFSKNELIFNGFKWGDGQEKILITHGWSSKAADFSVLIESLLQRQNVQVIAFDAPGNGSSAAELSNLILYIEAIKQIIAHYGEPAIVVGHSLGAMANMIALQQSAVSPQMLISIAPVIRLKALFTNIMDGVSVPAAVQEQFFVAFEETFQRPVTDYDLDSYYRFNQELHHWIAYDEDDRVVNSTYLNDFLSSRPFIQSTNYKGIGHEKLIRHAVLIDDLIQKMPSLKD